MASKAKILGQRTYPLPDDNPDGEKVVLTRFSITDAGSSFVVLPSPTHDARLLAGAGQTLPTFYLGGTGPQNQLNVENSAVGSEFLLASRHSAFGGFANEGE